MTTKDTPSKHREFLLFLLVGGFSAAVNVGARYVLNLWMSFEWAVLVAYLAGMTTAYLLSRRYVFAASGRSTYDEFLRFGLVNVAAAAQVWLISVGLARLVFPAIAFTWRPEDVAHCIGVAAPVITSYFGHRHFSFAKSRS
ncbi:MAG: GtrA family protein [Negativicutes bacterium]|nr:GtrA family protein [Negativicutes bacterium]